MENFLEAPLRLTPIRSWAVVFALVLGLVASMSGIALAGTEEDARWSIDFDAISLSEAFDQLTQITGIKIFTTIPLAHKISPKRYINQSIDQILKDMLKNVNYAAVWHYSERGIESIGILAFDRERSESHSNVSSVKRTDAIDRSLPRNSELRRLHSRSQVSGSGKYKSIQEAPHGVTETEGSEAEEKDEESMSTPMQVNDTPPMASSDTQAEPRTESSNGEESPPSDQQDESEE